MAANTVLNDEMLDLEQHWLGSEVHLPAASYQAFTGLQVPTGNQHAY